MSGQIMDFAYMDEAVIANGGEIRLPDDDFIKADYYSNELDDTLESIDKEQAYKRYTTASTDDNDYDDDDEKDNNCDDTDGMAAAAEDDLSALPSNPCFRCGKQVYPVEKIDVGVLFHRRCFRCRVCGLQLTLRSFQWDQEAEPDVYCSVHVARLVGTIDQDALGIRSALNAPRKRGSTNEQIRGSTHNPGWQYDANALEFEHQRELQSRGKHQGTMGTYKQFEESGVFDAQNQLERRQKEEEDLLYEQFLEERQKEIRRVELELEVEKEKSVHNLVSNFDQDHRILSWRDLEGVLDLPGLAKPDLVFTGHGSAFEPVVPSVLSRKLITPIPEESSQTDEDDVLETSFDDVLETSFDDVLETSFDDVLETSLDDLLSEEEEHKLFEKQKEQQQEELHKQQQKEQKRQQQELQQREQQKRQENEKKHQKHIEQERLRQQTEQQQQEQQQQQQYQQQIELQHRLDEDERLLLEQETERIEEQFRRKREERLRSVIENLSTEERTKVTRLIEKHSQEMLLMIAERVMATVESPEEADDGSYERYMQLTRLPPIVPPEVKKKQLYHSPRVFHKIDRHVFEVARRDHLTFTALVRDLTRHAQSDLEKARAIFLWITLKDLNKLEISEAVSPDSPLGLLRGIKLGTESYHDLIKRLCSYAGLYCQIIQGYSKGAGYKPGMKLEGPRFRNAWTAVFIDGSWQFINCNWGARHVKGELRSQPSSEISTPGQGDKLHYRCDEFYFVTDPEDHIFQHYPDNPQWQLLECPITMEDFIELPVVKSPFFNLGLQFGTYYECTLETVKGIVEINLKTPSLICFGHMLDAKDDNITSELLGGRVLLRIVGDRAIFTVSPPAVGRYYFTIYAKDDWHSDSLQSACAFQIFCNDKHNIRNTWYPKTAFFGPMPSISEYGIIPRSHPDPLIAVDGKDVVIEFALMKHIKISHSFQRFPRNRTAAHSTEGSDMARFSFLQYRDDQCVQFRLRCPLKGMYVFSMFGSRKDSGENHHHEHNHREYAPDQGRGNYECLYKYLMDCKTKPSESSNLPRACHRWYACALLEPVNGNLARNANIQCRLRAPLAIEVAVMVGDVWFHLKLRKDVWEGIIFTGNEPNKAKVYAKLEKGKSRFSPLVEFSVT